MLLTLDMGNTNITIGVFDGSRLLFESRVATDRSRMEDQYAAEFRNIFRLYQVDDRGFEGAVLPGGEKGHRPRPADGGAGHQNRHRHPHR